MDPARWARIRELLDGVGELPAADRDAALSEACGDDAELHEEVLRLLSWDTRADALVDDIVAGAVADLVEPSLVDERIGPYRVVAEIGHGGMGTVYLAERVDGHFEQQVALKLITPGLVNDEFLRRFRGERQILARLQHPSIARLLDGGIDDRGRLYFALEFVEGEPIDRYCDHHGLTVNERLALVIEACRAVSHAHGELVIHRDLKPAHVLVTRDRQVRLIDFGIAKALTPDMTAPGVTQVGLRPLTPEYAAPEQVRGEAVGTSSDVYALGVILYELVAGARPYDFVHRTPVEIERVVCHSDPEPPSVRVRQTAARSPDAAERFVRTHGCDATRLRQRLSGDLDVICLKALQKDPARRYPSAEALSEDLRRSLTGRPVLAQPDTLSYRLAKFATRHRVGLGLAAVAVVALAALMAFHTVRLAGERDRAQQEAAKADQIARFLQELFEVSDPSEARGRSVTARELLDEGAARIQTELAQQPEVRASLMRVIGVVYDQLGLYDSAKPLLEQALSDLRRLHGETHEDVAHAEGALAVLLQDMGDLGRAQPLYRRALDIELRLHGPQHEHVSERLGQLGFLLESISDFTEAERAARQVLETERLLFSPEHPRVATAKAKLAGLLRRLLRHDEAEPLLREALAAERRAYGDRSLEVASTARNLASLLRDRGAYDEAEALYQETLATRRALLGEAHPEMAITINSYAILLDRKGDADGAVTAYREGIRIQEAIHQGRPHPDLAASYSNLAATLRGLKRLDEAGDMYRRSIAVGDQVLPADHPNRAFARLGRAGVLMDQRRFVEAEPLVREALALRQKGLPAGHRYIGDALIDLGTCLTGLRQFAEAEAALLEAQRTFREGLGPDDERTGRAGRRLSALYTAWGRPPG